MDKKTFHLETSSFQFQISFFKKEKLKQNILLAWE